MKTRVTDSTRPSYPLTEAQIGQLEALGDRMPDTADIPPAAEANWATVVRGKQHAPMQGTVALRLDADVLAWLRRKGGDCEREINCIMREKMQSEA